MAQKTAPKYPAEYKNMDQLVKRVKKDLAWIIFSMAVAIAAAAVTYLIITKPV